MGIFDKVAGRARSILRSGQEGATPDLAPSSQEPLPQNILLTLAPGVSMEMVRVPAGPFLMGSVASDAGQANEMPQHSVKLGDYFVGKYPVTEAQFAAFVAATGYDFAAKATAGKENHPVTWIRWKDAVAFAEWASQVTGRPVRLPTEAEWEKAARGTDGRKYPWGNLAPDAHTCNSRESGEDDTTPVGKYSPIGDSPCGAADLSGNVEEWTSSLYKSYPYRATDGREDTAKGEQGVLRGGSYWSRAYSVRAAFRHWVPLNYRDNKSGFRVVVSPT